MAKSKGASDARKVVFFKTKGGKAQKSRNKRDKRSVISRGQGGKK
jgi:hypothetical protein